MSGDSQQAITHVLQQDSKALTLILGKLKLFKVLSSILNEYLEARIIKHCSVVNYENGHLVTITSSAIWATHFRFQIPNLIPKLQKHPEFVDLMKITCKIRPKIAAPAEHKPSMMKPIKPETAQFIKTIAASISHEKLRRIMQKIASYQP